MLVLSRKRGEKIHIDSGIVLEVLEINGSRVRFGIEAPRRVSVLRSELLCRGASGSRGARSATAREKGAMIAGE